MTNDPSLFYSITDINMLKEKAKSENMLQGYINQIIKDAEEALKLELVSEEWADQSDSQHGNYFDASIPFAKVSIILGTAFQFAGDVEYANKLKMLMLHYAAYKKWYGKGAYGRSELNNANFCYGMSCGYDLIKSELTTEEKKYIARETYKKGIEPIISDWLQPGTRLHALDTMGHNWWAVIVAQGGLAALTFSEILAECKEYPRKIAGIFEEWFGYAGNPVNAKPKNFDNGGCYEGIGYADYGIREYLLFRNAYVRKYGMMEWDDIKILTSCSKFFVNTFYPTSSGGSGINFGDHGQNEMAIATQLMLGAGIDNQTLRWYIKKWNRKEINIWDLIYYNEIYNKPARRPSNKSVIYKDIGWAILRSSYKDNMPMLAVKCGDTWNHAHADAGSFVFYNNGQEVICDSGTCHYHLKKYVEYYCSSYAHNVVLFNGMGQDNRDFYTHTRQKGRLYNMISTPAVKYIIADATGPMSRYYRKHLRHFLWLDDIIIIYDDIETYEKGQLNWILHTNVPGSLEVLYPKTTLEKKIGYEHKIPDRAVTNYSYNATTDDDCRGKFISAINYGTSSISFDELDEGYRITAEEWLVYINKLSDGRIMHKNCISKLDQYITDAVILAVKGEVYFVANGSLIRKDNISILENCSRTTKLI